MSVHNKENSLKLLIQDHTTSMLAMSACARIKREIAFRRSRNALLSDAPYHVLRDMSNMSHGKEQTHAKDFLSSKKLTLPGCKVISFLANNNMKTVV